MRDGDLRLRLTKLEIAESDWLVDSSPTVGTTVCRFCARAASVRMFFFVFFVVVGFFDVFFCYEVIFFFGLLDSG